VTVSTALARSSIAARFGPALLVRISLTPRFTVTTPARRSDVPIGPAVKSQGEEERTSIQAPDHAAGLPIARRVGPVATREER